MDQDVALHRIENLSNIREALAPVLSEKAGFSISESAIHRALFLVLEHKEELESLGDLWQLDFTYEQVFRLVQHFDFRLLDNEIVTDDWMIAEELLLQQKVWIKHKGHKWVIHKNDADPFPSSPHAHDFDQHLKLDLSNGDCYRGKQVIETLRKKDLLLIREAAEAKMCITMPGLTI